MDFKNSNNKRYNTLDSFYKNKFGFKVFKISLNGGFECPHSGCFFCSVSGSGEYGGNPEDDLITQFNKIKDMMHKKWPSGKYIGYFQARTNTLAPVDVLKEKYELILKQENVIGLNIATRPDSIDDECFDYLKELNQRTFLTIELGLQTIHSETEKYLNRGHDLQCFTDMVLKLRQENINVVVHIMNGLPYESFDMMIDTIKYINKLDIQGVKIHMLSVLKNTKLEDIYNLKNFPILSKEEYIKIVSTQLCYLNPDIVIHRLTGDPCIDDLITPHWTIKKTIVLNDIDKYMRSNDLYQGKFI